MRFKKIRDYNYTTFPELVEWEIWFAPTKFICRDPVFQEAARPTCHAK